MILPPGVSVVFFLYLDGLGATYLKQFFDLTRNPKDIKRSQSAFNRSEKLEVESQSASNPDLYLNRSIVTH